MDYFVEPPAAPFQNDEEHYTGNSRTYTEYNYLRPGLASKVRKRHFEVALRIAEPYFGRTAVIDMGCADGVFLPSLGRYFPQVVAVDKDSAFIRVAHRVVEAACLEGVTPICNVTNDFKELSAMMPAGDYKLLFLLEVMEHVGEPGRAYESKLEFLENCAALLSGEDARLIVSVPKMVGFSFMFQRLGLWLLKQRMDPITWKNLWRATLFGETEALEASWKGGHLGFNHRRMEESWKGRFEIVARHNLAFQMVYCLRKCNERTGSE